MKMDKMKWKNRKRTGGIRRKCLREYKKMKKSIVNWEIDNEVVIADETIVKPSSSSTSEVTREVRSNPSVEEGSVSGYYNGSASSEDDSDSDIHVELKNSTLRSEIRMYRTTYPYNNRNIVAIKFSDVQFKFACTIYSGNIYCIPLIHTL